ncbi:hypothetical protein AN4581.2 [Aspergillus nidulans FGSC A4]|uniref:Nuclear protein (Sgd1), putative (AFU_orthologue AFUA_2G01980) n=1 Tax=Emericella nidulans (strain FGSC A4 / ATCC 38163 / CBS 112.46 / NRRL 194 / M139) TaxID=227321 RepID=Q5B4E9_EMENI|nr:hypothetical protein [Aspergillus nidulans FGSC A4]EAA60924.1 hypothetical protein AN4581.2 [Aspergillus nidulans FGSC A4]CBF77213.1 TPA: nuclear protein (Sgd1), putative (AFU_orthologue; AFUA_2G01980) [Aspergillus nidulans FGSC A4]|eukprot:XP_662185.1 hypothetical protein AN4581.2 [Aspergillus nidulans FGSC A4]
MPRPRHNTTSLPRGLRQELGIRDRYGERKNKRIERSRKDLRREERAENKRGGPGSKKSANSRHRDDEDDDNDFDDLGDGSDFDGDSGESDEDDGDVMAKLKAAKQKMEKPSASSRKVEDDALRDVPRKEVSKAVQDQLDQDDAEIAALEKKLGLKKGKLPKSFAEDGLDELLGDLGGGSADEDRKRKREADEWLLNKRRKAQGMPVEESEASGSDDMSDEDLESLPDDEDIDGFDEEDGEDESEDDQPAPKKRENPYVAPVVATTEDKPGKYIPPSLRAASSSESESLTRLRRQAQGHLNKLSEANLVSILAEFEKLYREYPRQNVTSTLVTLLFGLICERSALQDTFIILHAGFIAAVYKVMGMDFGAEIVQKIVETFDAGGDDRGKFEGKEMINLISLLSQLYNFHVVGSTLVFDYIRLFLQDINEDNTELLLKVIRNSGPQLRQDDPSSLKDIVLLIQPAVTKAGTASLSVRTKFMIDTITDLKNNRLKSAANSTIASEHITKMRKILGSLNNSRVIRATEPISISRSDIHNSSKKGKWWLVGASWKEDPLESARQELSSLSAANTHQATIVADDSEAEPDYASIAKAHRMNTDVRRSIFVAIMSATDFQDAHVRLLKLRLKRAQEFEIPRVLTHCAMEEDAHNPYYTLIARRLCGELGRRIKMSFMFTLWNIFKRMGESGDMDDDEEDGSNLHGEDEENPLSMKSVVNLAKMYASLIADGTLTLGILKTLNFAYLQPKTKAFVEVLMISIIQQSQKQKKNKKSKSKSKSEDSLDEQPLVEIFMKTEYTPQIIKGCIFFLRKVVAKTDIVASEKEAVMVKWGVRVAVDALKVVESKESKFS